MINHIILFFLTVIIYEFVRYIRFIKLVKANLDIYKKIYKLFKYKNISDNIKEKLILNYSKSLFIISSKIILFLILILAFIFMLNLLFPYFFHFVISILSFIELSILFIVYHHLRKKLNAKL